MNLTFLSKTDKVLASMRDLQNADGKQARTEIRRRMAIAFSDCTNIAKIANATVEAQSRVGMVTRVVK